MQLSRYTQCLWGKAADAPKQARYHVDMQRDTQGKVHAYDPAHMVPTWPVIGWNIPLPPAGSEAWEKEKAFITQQVGEKIIWDRLDHYRVFGLRRAVWVQPTRTEAHYHGDNLHIHFSLPSGAYASILFDKLQERMQQMRAPTT